MIINKLRNKLYTYITIINIKYYYIIQRLLFVTLNTCTLIQKFQYTP